MQLNLVFILPRSSNQVEARHFVVVGLADGFLNDDQIVWWRDRVVNDSRGVQGTWNGHWIRLDCSREPDRGRAGSCNKRVFL